MFAMSLIHILPLVNSFSYFESNSQILQLFENAYTSTLPFTLIFKVNLTFSLHKISLEGGFDRILWVLELALIIRNNFRFDFGEFS